MKRGGFTKVRKHQNYIVLVLCVVSTLVLYYKVLAFGFVSDDYHMLYITQNQGNVFGYFLTNLIGQRGGHSYGPIFNILFTLQHSLFGLKAFGFHFVSLLFHAGNVFLVYLLGKKFGKRELVGISAALLFLTLQSHTSVIAWVSAQPHLIATFFFLLGIFLHIRFLEEKQRKFFWLSLLSFSTSIFTKEITIIFLPFLFFLEILFGQRIKNPLQFFKRAFCHLAPFMLLFVIYILLRNYTTGSSTGFYAASGFGFHVLPWIRSFIEFSVSMFLPHPYRQLVMSWLSPYIGLVMLGVAGIIYTVIHFAKSDERKMMVGVLFGYLILIIPFLRLGFNMHSNEGERYTYLTSTFFVIAFILFLYSLLRKIRFSASLFIFIIALLSLLSFDIMNKKVGDWQKTTELAQNAFSVMSDDFLKENDIVYFLGLPDTLNGAQLFRNGIVEAFKIEKGFDFLEAERVFMLSRLSRQNYNQNIIELEKSCDGVYMFKSTCEDCRLFTGLPNEAHTYGEFLLTDFRAFDHSGLGIFAALNEFALESIDKKGKHIVFVYFSEGIFKKVYDHDIVCETRLN
ncbi:MAG: glycosyltransferase family 39 protein [Candidatus Magasanikbacteria bacterium]